MALDFSVKDIIHRVAVKFARAFLPGAKKPYYLKAVHQTELDLRGIASKAEVYNIHTSPKVIYEGAAAMMELIYYLAADGYIIKTPLFNLRMRVPGEYTGAETHLPEGVHPEAVLHPAAEFRNYLKDRVHVQFDGFEQYDGIIGEAVDEATGRVNEAATIGNILTIHGLGLKIEADDGHKSAAGLFFEAEDGAHVAARVHAPVIAVNEPRTLKAVVPAGLKAGTAYRLGIITQSSVTHGSVLLKELREIWSDFMITAQT